MNKRLIAVVVIVFLAVSAIRWLQADGKPFDIRSILPFLGDRTSLEYGLGGLALIGLGVWGILRLHRPPEDQDEAPEAEDTDESDFEPSNAADESASYDQPDADEGDE